ncbi:MAG TPA: hypothetical protein VFH73_04060 [Polyangia bacterium]|nr:hypothetical protein [Polyangia bacterium]
MRLRVIKVLTVGFLAGGLTLSTASARAAELLAGGCHLGGHPHAHAESSWAWLLLLLLPLALRGRFFRRR